MKDKTCIITGANAGIGYETAMALAEKGARIIMICRNPQKGQEALAAIRAQSGSDRHELYVADLASQQEIRRAAQAILRAHPVIDVFIHNAGTWISRLTHTAEGHETVFAVNHLAGFLLTHLLYPHLRKAPDARIIHVSSDSHFQIGRIHFDDLSLSRRYHGLRSYAQSKLAQVMFTYEFEGRKPDPHVSVHAVQPGLVHTDIGLKHTSWFHSLAWKARRGWWKSLTPAEGAQTPVYLASEPEGQSISGKYWDKCRPKPSSKASYNEADAARLWQVSMEMCGIRDFFAGEE